MNAGFDLLYYLYFAQNNVRACVRNAAVASRSGLVLASGRGKRVAICRR